LGWVLGLDVGKNQRPSLLVLAAHRKLVLLVLVAALQIKIF
jgi:hypothetical protein